MFTLLANFGERDIKTHHSTNINFNIFDWKGENIFDQSCCMHKSYGRKPFLKFIAIFGLHITGIFVLNKNKKIKKQEKKKKNITLNSSLCLHLVTFSITISFYNKKNLSELFQINVCAVCSQQIP